MPRKTLDCNHSLLRGTSVPVPDLTKLKLQVEQVCLETGVTAGTLAANKSLSDLISSLQTLAALQGHLVIRTPNLKNSLQKSQQIQDRNLEALKAKGAPGSVERIEQITDIVDQIRSARRLSAILPNALLILGPKRLLPGSLDHFRFLNEFVKVDNDIVRTVAAWSGSHEGTSFNNRKVLRLDNTGVVSVLDMMQKTVEKRNVNKPRIYKCGLCTSLTTPPPFF